MDACAQTYDVNHHDPQVSQADFANPTKDPPALTFIFYWQTKRHFDMEVFPDLSLIHGFSAITLVRYTSPLAKHGP